MSPHSPILVCFAMEREARALRKRVPGLPRVRFLITGMGPSAASSRVEPALTDIRPAVVLTCGFAGALDPALPRGRILFQTRNDRLSSDLMRLGAKPGAFHCSTRIAISAADKAALHASTQAQAVEMESGAIHAICDRMGIPCATVRAISDVAGETLPLDFNRLCDSQGQLATRRLAIAIASRPWVIPRLVTLGRHSAAAAGALASLLQRFLHERNSDAG